MIFEQSLNRSRPGAAVRLPAALLTPTAHRKPGILVHVHPVLPRIAEARNSSFLGQDRVDNLMKAHS